MAYYDLEGTGSSIQSHRMGEWANDDLITTIYNAVQGVETGGLHGDDQYIRTNLIPPGGSTSYGPLQINAAEGDMMSRLYHDEDHKNRLGITDDELYFVQQYLEQGVPFVKYGGKDMPPGGIDPETGEDISRYGYGGQGDLWSKENQALYESVGKKLINFQWHDQAKGDPVEFAKKWRMGTGEKAEADWEEYMKTKEGQNYLNKFLGGLGK